MRRLQRPLDPKAVKAANAALSAETGGRQLTMEPEDAGLRKKWIDAYLKAGGKEATGFNPKQVRKPVQECPNKNWVEVEYLYADDRRLNDKQTGVEGAIAIIKHNGSEIARARLDSCGFAHIDGIPVDITTITYCFDNDPPQYEIFPQYKPHLKLPPVEPDFIDRAKGKLNALAEWHWNLTKSGAEWVGGALAGDFNEDPSMGQIAFGTVITLIPIVDQAGDVRDIVAALKKLIFDKRYDDKWVWFDLIITIIGCIPEVGTAIKGVAKVIVKKGLKGGLKIADVLKRLNWIGKGNAVQWLKKLSGELPQHGKNAAKKIEEILVSLAAKLNKVKKFVSEKVVKQIDEMLESINEVRKRINNKVDEIITEFKNKLDELLESLKRVEKQGSTQKKNTLKQEKEAFEIGADTGKAATKEGRKVLALGLKDNKKGLDYNKWAKDNNWNTYGDLSGRGSFSEQIQEAMNAADDIHFNLDGVNPKKASGKLNDYGEPAAGYTNYELWLLQNDKKFGDKVVWYKDGKAMPKGYNPFSE